MRIVLDGRWIGRTGIGRYAAALLDELQDIDSSNEYVVLLLPEEYARWRPRNANFRAVATTCEVYTWQEQLLLPSLLRQLRPDLVHFTSFNWPVLYTGRFVTTIHDLTLVEFKNVRGQGWKQILYELKYLAMKGVLAAAAARARALMVPTDFVKAELEKRFPNSQGKVVVTPEAVDRAFARPGDIGRLGLPAKFMLYVGNYYPYKNLGRLVEAFAQTKARHEGVKLMFVGKADYFQEQIRARVASLGLGDEVVWPGRVSDSELAALYEAAALYVFPSLSEGFGLPGLEAMAHGAPVLASRESCLPEVYGEAAAYFDPHDAADMAGQIDALLGDKERLAALSEAGRAHVERFSWRRMAEQTLKQYVGGAKAEE